MDIKVYSKLFPIVKLTFKDVSIFSSRDGLANTAPNVSHQVCVICLKESNRNTCKECPRCGSKNLVKVSKRSGATLIRNQVKIRIIHKFGYKPIAEPVMVSIAATLCGFRRVCDIDHLLHTVFSFISNTIVADDRFIVDTAIVKQNKTGLIENIIEVKVTPVSLLYRSELFEKYRFELFHWTKNLNPEEVYISRKSKTLIGDTLRVAGDIISRTLPGSGKLGFGYRNQIEMLRKGDARVSHLTEKDLQKLIPLIRKGAPLNAVHGLLRDSRPIVVEKPNRRKD